MWLDLADEMGILTVGSLPVECMGLPLSTPELPRMVENELRRSILRDRSRTSIVQWEMFNELQRPILKQMMRPMALLARELDPTRLILDESGGWAFGANLYLPGEFEPTKFNDIHTYPGPFIHQRLYDGFLAIGLSDEEAGARGLTGRAPGRNVVPGLMSFVSELGYGSLPDLVAVNRLFREAGNPLTPAYRYHQRLAEEQERMLRESGFDEICPDPQQFYLDQQAIHGAANKRMIEAVRSNPEVDGYAIHALTAGDWILGAGLLDLWRNPKGPAYELTKAANLPRILPIRVIPRNVYSERGARLEVEGVSELEPLDGELEIEVVSSDGKVVLAQRSETVLERGVSSLFTTDLRTGDLDGTYSVRVRLRTPQGDLVVENSDSFDVFGADRLKPAQAKVLVLDPGNHLIPFLDRAEVDYSEFSSTSEGTIPVLVSAIRADEAEAEGQPEALLRYVANGGTAGYLRGAGRPPDRGADPPTEIENPWLPLRPRFLTAKGLWTCIPHLVKDHPIFEGLPSRGMMRDIYENVWADTTLVGLGGETIVGSIGFVWFAEDHALGYMGPGASWWGADVAQPRTVRAAANC